MGETPYRIIANLVFCWISLILSEVVMGILRVVVIHNIVSGDFCHNEGACYVKTLSISLLAGLLSG